MGLGVQRLNREAAGASLEQRDPTRDEAGEVARVTATRARLRCGRGRVDGLDVRGDVSRARVRHREEVDRLRVRLRIRADLLELRRSEFLEERKVEPLDSDEEALVAEAFNEVRDRGLVPGCSRRARPVVRIRDRLERLQMLDDLVGLDVRAKLRRIRCAPGRGRAQERERRAKRKKAVHECPLLGEVGGTINAIHSIRRPHPTV